MGVLFYSLFFIVILVLVVVGLFFYRMSQMPNPTYKQPNQKIQPFNWSNEHVTVGWIGHSTIYINMYGVKIITDPVLVDRIGMPIGWGENWKIGPKRHMAPAIDLNDVEEVDLVLLSHTHMDHLDYPSLRKVVGKNTEIITATKTSHLFNRIPHKKVYELGANETLELSSGLRVIGIPVRHWGNRYPWNKSYGYTGFILEHKGSRVLYPGDTAYIDTFIECQKFGKIDLAFMPIGAYDPDSFQTSHCTPEQAWKMFLDTGATFLVPIHWNTFVLSFEPVGEPIERLLQAASGEEKRIVIRDVGESFQLPQIQENVSVKLSENNQWILR